jgi:hypothetical protein
MPSELRPIEHVMVSDSSTNLLPSNAYAVLLCDVYMTKRQIRLCASNFSDSELRWTVFK